MPRYSKEFTVNVKVINQSGFDGIENFKKGDIRDINDFSDEEKEIFVKKACKNQGVAMSDYYNRMLYKND